MDFYALNRMSIFCFHVISFNNLVPFGMEPSYVERFLKENLSTRIKLAFNKVMAMLLIRIF